MYPRNVRIGIFALEGLNAFAMAMYLNYLFFIMRQTFGFENLENLTLAATNGFVYMAGSWLGGKFGQRHGYFRALRTGFAVMALSLSAGLLVRTVAGHYCVMAAYTLGASLTWPAMEAILSEKATSERLQDMVGIYNLVWSVTSAFAVLAGGALLERAGPRGFFVIPASVNLLQFVLASLLARTAKAALGADRSSAPCAPAATDPLAAAPGPGGPALRPPTPRSPVAPRTFMKMAWLANPLSYVAINSLIPVIPRIAADLDLSPALAGAVGSVWFFTRSAAFFALWRWTGWHYRFRWLLGSFVAMIVCYWVIQLVPLASHQAYAVRLAALIGAQVVFGASIGLSYYSSLFYSMDVGETKGEHGGFHEAALGSGLFVGPFLGAAALRLFPASPASAAWAVTGLLGLGALALLLLRHLGERVDLSERQDQSKEPDPQESQRRQRHR
jgi:MFS family permease